MENKKGYKALVAVVASYFARYLSILTSNLDETKDDYGLSVALGSSALSSLDKQLGTRFKTLKVSIANGSVKETVAGTALREIKQGLTPEAKKWLQRNALDRASSISDTMRERMKTVFADLADKDADLLEVRKTLKATFSELSDGKLDTIASTEYRTAYAYGQNDALEELDQHLSDSGKKVVRTWTTAADEKVRDSHAAMEGEQRDIGEAFSNGLQFPCDPAGPPEETINCRCSLEVSEVDDSSN